MTVFCFVFTSVAAILEPTRAFAMFQATPRVAKAHSIVHDMLLADVACIICFASGQSISRIPWTHTQTNILHPVRKMEKHALKASIWRHISSQNY